MSSNFEGSQSPPLMIHKFHHAAFLTWGKVPGSIPRPPYLAPGQPRSGALTGRLDFGVARNTVRMEANLVEGNPTKMEVQSDMPAKTLASNLLVYQVLWGHLVSSIAHGKTILPLKGCKPVWKCWKFQTFSSRRSSKPWAFLAGGSQDNHSITATIPQCLQVLDER